MNMFISSILKYKVYLNIRIYATYTVNVFFLNIQNERKVHIEECKLLKFIYIIKFWL